MKLPRCGGLLLGAALAAGAQTRVDIRSQSKNIDFSNVPTRSFRTGTALPAACAVGETFFKTDAPAGGNFYGCTSLNVWTLESLPELPAAAGQAGKLLSNDGSKPVWTNMAGDILGTAGAILVQGLQGRAVSGAAPSDGNALKWNGSLGQWEPGVLSTSLTGDANGPAGNTVVKALQGRAVAATAPSDGQTLKWNGSLGQWEPGVSSTTLAGDASGPAGGTVVKALQGRSVATTAPADGEALKWNGVSNRWEPGVPKTTVSGDASGPAENTVVQRLQGRAVAPDLPGDGQALKWNAASSRWEPGVPKTTISGDASGPADNTVVQRLQGRAVSTKSPASGQALRWNGTLNEWEPGTPDTMLTGDASGAAGSTTVKALQGRAVSTAIPADGQALEWNGAANQWEPRSVPTTVSGDANGPLANAVVQGLQGRPVSAAKPTDGQGLVWNGTVNQWQPGTVNSTLTGDASGPAGSTVVKGLQGRTVSAAIPADGQGLKWNAPANQWEPGAPSTTLAGDATGAAGATVVRRLQGRAVSTAAPADGQTLKWNAVASQWEPGTSTGTLSGDASGPAGATVVTALRGRGVSAASPSAGQTLTWNGSSNQWEPGTPATTLAGDASGPGGSTLVRGLQGRALSAAEPTNGQTLKWNASLSQWEPGGAPGNYSAGFTNQTSVVVPGTAHGFTTADLLVQCYAGSGVVLPSSVSIDGTSHDVTIGFSTAQSGRCVINGSAAGGSSTGGGSSAVASVFGRTGVVTAQAGDYSFSQIAGTVSNGQLGSGIDAAKIGSGGVSSAAFGYLANVQSDVQAQLDAKSARDHSHEAGGDVSGDLGATVVTGIQGRAVAATAANDGQVLTWNGAAGQWEPRDGGGASGSAGSPPGFAVTRSSATELTIGADCSPASPCNVRFGNTVRSIQTPSKATVNGGSGTAFIYVTQNGTVTVGHNLSVACSGGCTAAAGVSGFPFDAIPIATWNASSGSWDSQGTDWRSWLSGHVVNAGEGMVVVEAGGVTTVAVDTAVVPTYVTASATLDFPSISNGSCSPDMSIPLPGAAPGDAVAANWPATLQSGVLGMMFVGAADSVSVRVCNLSGMTVNPAPATFGATVIRSF